MIMLCNIYTKQSVYISILDDSGDDSLTQHPPPLMCAPGHKGSHKPNIHKYNCFILHIGTITCLAFCKGSHMLSGSQDGTICIWECKTWECLKVLKGHRQVNQYALCCSTVEPKFYNNSQLLLQPDSRSISLFNFCTVLVCVHVYTVYYIYSKFILLSANTLICMMFQVNQGVQNTLLYMPYFTNYILLLFYQRRGNIIICASFWKTSSLSFNR